MPETPLCNPEFFRGAHWIGAGPSCEGACSGKLKTAYFRIRFSLPRDARLKFDISAHSRYRLWVNGMPAAYGPCKGDRWRQFFDTLQLDEYLREGENWLAVKVLSYPPYEAQSGEDRAPSWSVGRAVGPCMIAQGVCTDRQGNQVFDLTTGKALWESLADEAIDWKFFPITGWMGSMESVRGDRLPHGWQTGRDSRGWAAAERLWPSLSGDQEMFGIIPHFPLAPRPIPPAFETNREFLREMPLKHGDVPAFSFRGAPGQAAAIPPHSKMAVELDAGELTTGFISLPVSGGQGSRVTIRYAEGYSRLIDWKTQKGRRDDWERYDLLGCEDTYFPGGGEETYEPHWFRTFRFVRIEAETAEEPLFIRMPRYVETGYPLEVLSSVSSPEQWVGRLWDISLRTLRRCMHETYEDCPYYEQMQYIQDTRLETLFTYCVGTDTRLAHRAIEDFHASLLPDGMLQARYPTCEPLVIPPFSLQFPSMLLEYYWQTGDISVLRRYRPTVDAVLDWFDRKIGSYGLVEKLGYWEQIDWVEQWDSVAGRTPAGAAGPATTHNLIYAVALQAGAAVNRATGREGVAQEYEARAAAITAGVGKYCWSEKEQLFMEGPEYEEYSQHAKVYAVLSGLAVGEKARALLARALRKPGIAVCSFAWQFFLFRALEKCDAYELTEKQWDLWKALLEKNLTTVPEIPEDGRSARSDCHAWSALPLYEFTRCILGVKAALPGWKSIVIRPHALSLPGASGVVATPKGPVKVAWENTRGEFKIDVETPRGVPAVLILPDGQRKDITRK